MHELSIMSNILDIVVEFAGKHGARRVTGINLRVGDLSDLVPEWMQTYFDFVSKETVAEKAEIRVTRVPAVLKCRRCAHEFTLNKENWQFNCPKCESAEVELLSGREFTVESIEIE